MFRRFRMGSFVVTILVAVIFGIGVAGVLCGEPPGGIKYKGKGIDAVLTLTIVPVGNTEIVVEVLVTECNGQPLVFGPLLNNFVPDAGSLVGVTADLLLNQLVGYAPPGCFSTAGGEPLYISIVNEFYNAAAYEEVCPGTGAYVPRGALGAHVELNIPSP